MNKIGNNIKSKLMWVFPLMLLAILLVPKKVFAFELLPFEIRPVYAVLRDNTDIKNIWQIVLNFVNGFIIIILIAVAFAQILRLNVNTYGIKKILPALVLAVIAANFSYLFCRLLVDTANILISGIINGGVEKDALTKAMNGGADGGWASPLNSNFKNTLATNGGSVFWFLIMQLLLIASGVIIYVLAFLFFIRTWMIYFLVPLAPLALMATVLPQTKSLFNQWWSNFSKWVYMPVVSIFWIWLGSKWIGAVENSFFMQIVFAGICFYLAITTPFKLGGAVMSAWAGLGKKVPKWGYRQTGGIGNRMALSGQNLMKQNPEGSRRWKLGKALSKTGGVVNVPGMVNAYKAGRKEYIDKLGKAEMKTGTYARFGGEAVRIIGAKAKNEDTLANMPAEITANNMKELEDGIERFMADNSSDRRTLKMKEDLAGLLGIKKRPGESAEAFYGRVDGADPRKRREAMRRLLAADGVGNLLLKYQGMTGLENEDKAVLAEGFSKNFIRDRRGQRTSTAIEENYRPGNGPLQGSDAFPRQGGNASPISGIEEEISAGISAHIGNIHQILGDKSGELIGLAVAGAKDVDLSQFVGSGKGTMSAGVKDALEESFKAICDLRDQIVQEEMGIGNADLEKEMLGAMRVFGSAKKGVSMGVMQLDIQKGLMALRNNQEKEAGDIAKKYFENIEYDKGNLEKIFGEAQTGIAHFKSAGIPADIKSLDWHEYQGTVRDQRQSQIQTQAEMTAATNLHMASLAPKIQGNVSSIASNPEALERLTGEINKLGETLSQTHGISAQQLGSQQVQQAIVGFADSRQLAVGQTPIAAVLNDKTFQRSLAKEIGRSVGTAFSATAGKQTTTNVTNVTNVGAESQTPPQPEEPKGPTTTTPPPKEEE